jgi:hypothetical protein
LTSSDSESNWVRQYNESAEVLDVASDNDSEYSSGGTPTPKVATKSAAVHGDTDDADTVDYNDAADTRVPSEAGTESIDAADMRVLSEAGTESALGEHDDGSEGVDEITTEGIQSLGGRADGRDVSKFCVERDALQIRSALTAAIQSGALAYNRGQVDVCANTYARVALNRSEVEEQDLPDFFMGTLSNASEGRASQRATGRRDQPQGCCSVQ